jgi:putative membrane protein (TIGR04086 family)
MLRRIHWLTVLAAAILVEFVLLAVAIPLNMSASGRALLLAIVIPLCVLGTFGGGWWAARRASRLFLIHGLLVGALAALIYAGLTWKVSLPTAYIVANYLKLIGGAAGGLTAQLRHLSPNAAQRRLSA